MTLIIFDLDGTLVDSREDITDAVNATRQAHGLPALSLPAVVSCIGDGMRNLVSRTIPDITEEQAFEALVKEYSGNYNARLTNKTHLYPGVAETLPVLAQHHKLAVASNKPDAATKRILQVLGVAHYFSAIVGGGVCKNLKPHPEIAYLCAELCGVSTKGGWFVGDHRTDLGVAHNAAMHACFCAYGIGRMETQRADAVIQNFSLLSQIIH